ncbi:hypothetical protein BCR36DRAFT_397972 [Piromyces finnis]|uniref:WH2 domain-containing protein n=1 Tax=Piromyces finnis TaxID=1754191 RepID=A0A1Y1V7U4_9FUNG|nr:hypothetical protein BCR36DRAFT_397972 [Piromyces finnis]|eukprot:ORX48911.1 hypothetical protein BCR36DRAFT_397972 [Piromyces finnis]
MNLIQLTQLLGQLSQISQYANELFSGLIKQANETSERINNIKARINNINSNIVQVETKMSMMKVSNIPNPECMKSFFKYNIFILIEYKPHESVEENIFTKQSQSFAINEAYQKCKDIPNFAEIDLLRTDGYKCAKLYSDPEIFFEEYKDVVKKDIDAKQKKKEERKKDKVKVKKEKKIRELSKKQYNSDGEVINQRLDRERSSEYRKSKLSQPDTNITEKITPMDTNSMMASPITMSTNSAVPPPPPPSIPSIPALPTMPQPPLQLQSIGQIPPPYPSIGLSTVPSVPMPMPMPVPVSANVPPPPPPPAVVSTNIPPPPPPAPSGGLPAINNNALQNVQLKSATPVPAQTNTRDDLLSNIKMGGFKLRKVEINEKRKPNDDLEGRNDVAALLIRRVALEDSDSESEGKYI